jgi:uncharacterized protein YndB with AHSA1/START domain
MESGRFQVEDRPDRVRRDALLPAPPDRVWETLTETGELSAWFGAEAIGEFRRGGRLTFRWGDGRERAAVIEDLDPPHSLTFRWLRFERYPEGETRMRGPGRVEINLEAIPEGTRITVAEHGDLGGVLTVGR